MTYTGTCSIPYTLATVPGMDIIGRDSASN